MAFQLSLNSISFVLVLVSFVFLLLATISVPVVETFRLAETNDYTYGILGYCRKSSNACSSASYPYMLGNIDRDAGWRFANSTRNSLARIFILCPIAAGLSLITLIVLFVSHFLSNKFLLVGIAVNTISFILAVITAVIVILAFYPNVSWTGWILVGAAAASLVSIIFLILTSSLRSDDKGDSDDQQQYDDLTDFDQKFNDKMDNNIAPPPSGFTSKGFNNFSSGYGNYDKTAPDSASSISKEYEFKANPVGHTQMTKTASNSSVYENKPQMTQDFTRQGKQGTIPADQRTNGSSFYSEGKVSLVNGPNTPISANKNFAPNIPAKVATPTSDGTNSNFNNAPYPRDSTLPLDRKPINHNQMSVFEHHPNAEHKPFTELDDENGQTTGQLPPDIDSDVDSDFTSVSQRAPNPQYHSHEGNQSYFPPTSGYQYQQGYQAPPNQFHQPPFSQTPVMQYPANYAQSPAGPPGVAPMATPSKQSYYSQPPPQQRANTVSDNVLSNNPDFSLGMGAANKRKQFYGAPMNKPGNRMNPGSAMGQRNRPNDRGGVRDGPYGMRDGPYGVLH